MGWNSGYTVMEKTVVSIHPTQKPIDLYRWIAKEYIEPGWKSRRFLSLFLSFCV